MKFLSAFLMILSIGGHAAWAGENEQDKHFFPTEEEKNTPFFDRNSWVSTTHLAFYGPEDPNNRDIRMTLVNIGAERYFRRNLGIVADAYLVSTSGDISHDEDPTLLNSDSLGIGGSLGLKWHFWRGERWSAYVNGSVGFLYTGEGFPAGGTSLNTLSRADLGITFQLQRQLHLVTSASLVHVSNGKGLKEANPSFNGEGGYIGVVYRFDKMGIFN